MREGWTLGDRDASGAQIVGEIGYRTEFRTAAYPANLEAGMVWDDRNGYSNVKGTGQTATPATTATDYPGGGVIFLQGAKVLARGPDRPGLPPINLQVYGQLDAAVDKPQPLDLDAAVGLNLTGVIPFRPADKLGIEARYPRLSDVEAAFETLRRQLAFIPPPARGLGGLGTLLRRRRYLHSSVAGSKADNVLLGHRRAVGQQPQRRPPTAPLHLRNHRGCLPSIDALLGRQDRHDELARRARCSAEAS